jgi:hypothetical protein
MNGTSDLPDFLKSADANEDEAWDDHECNNKIVFTVVQI